MMQPLVADTQRQNAQVSYRRSTSTHLSLHVPLDAAVNRDAVESYKERQVCREAATQGGGSDLRNCMSRVLGGYVCGVGGDSNS